MGEAFCLRLMQADGMNDNLSGNPAMPPPHRHDCSGQRGNHRHAPVCPLAAGMGITDSHPCALIAAGTKSQAATPLPSPQQEWKSQQPPLCPPRSRNRNHKQPPSALPAAGTGITSRHPSACFQKQPISPDSCQGCPGDISVYIKV